LNPDGRAVWLRAEVEADEVGEREALDRITETLAFLRATVTG
jgi:hypothetical protein